MSSACYRSDLILIGPGGSPPAWTEPVGVDEVCAAVGIEASVLPPEAEAYIATLISEARAVAEVEQGRDLLFKQWELRVYTPPSGGGAVSVPQPTIAVAAYVVEENGSAASLDVRWERGGRVTPSSGAWPVLVAPQFVRLLVSSGMGADDEWWHGAGASVRSAIIAMAAHRWLSRGEQGEAPWWWQLAAAAGRTVRV